MENNKNYHTFKMNLIEALEQKLIDGVNEVKTLEVTNKDYASIIMNLLQTEKTIKDLQSQIDYDNSLLDNTKEEEVK